MNTEYKAQSAPAPVGEEEAAENYANNAGYPKSDKEHFETTYWTQHNIAANGYKKGFQTAVLLHKPSAPGEEEIEDAAKKLYPFPKKGQPGFYEIFEQQLKRQEIFKEGVKWYASQLNRTVSKKDIENNWDDYCEKAAE